MTLRGVYSLTTFQIYVNMCCFPFLIYIFYKKVAHRKSFLFGLLCVRCSCRPGLFPCETDLKFQWHWTIELCSISGVALLLLRDLCRFQARGTDLCQSYKMSAFGRRAGRRVCRPAGLVGSWLELTGSGVSGASTGGGHDRRPPQPPQPQSRGRPAPTTTSHRCDPGPRDEEIWF